MGKDKVTRLSKFEMLEGAKSMGAGAATIASAGAAVGIGKLCLFLLSMLFLGSFSLWI